MAKKKNDPKDPTSYITINGQTIEIRQHPTDFSILANIARVSPENVTEQVTENIEEMAPLSPSMTRACAKSSEARDEAMAEVRRRQVAHHIYQVEATGEEIIIDDRIFLRLRHEGTGELEKIMNEHHLTYVRQIGNQHVLQLTNATGMNPIKLTNLLNERPEVESASPQIMLNLHQHQQPALFGAQWYLHAGSVSHPDVAHNADVRAPEAWQLSTGNADIVVAVLDDGFDLGHEVFSSTPIHPEPWDATHHNNDVRPQSGDYHGTPVASIAIGSHSPTSAMRGLAPGCTFLPVRIDLGMTSQLDMLEAIEYISARADVLNCSFGYPPFSFDILDRGVRDAISQICQSGGRRGRGLVIVFSAGNYDAPTFLDGADNVNGVLFAARGPLGWGIFEIEAGMPVYSGFPMIHGVVVAGAMSSLTRKSGYSSWGPHLTLSAPSNNSHYITQFIAVGADPRRAKFVADYRGLGQIAAVNRPGNGSAFTPISGRDDPATPNLDERFYTEIFGGTSGAAPLIAGVAALMLSVNPLLSATEVRRILASTADKNVNITLDLQDDPNLQGMTGEFHNGRSIYFGAGKLDAYAAVARAQALAGLAQSEIASQAVATASQTPLKRAAFAQSRGKTGTTLAQISAADFIHELEQGGLSLRDLFIWEEKKKVELWVEPENFGGIDTGDLIDSLRNEKKKYEFEDPPIFEPPFPPFPPVVPVDWCQEKKKVELELPFRLNSNANGGNENNSSFEHLVDQLTRSIRARLAEGDKAQ